MIKFPFISMQQMNLDWLLHTVMKILDFVPIHSGASGEVLQRTVDGAVWQPIGAVSLDIHDLNSTVVDGSDEIPVYDPGLMGNYKITVQDILNEVPAAPVDSVNGQTGTVVLTASDVGLGNVDNVQQYSVSNPPPYPVTSVNGKTGSVVTKDLFFDNTQDSVTVSIDNVLDPSNDSTINQQTVFLMKDADKRVIRLCGNFRVTSGSNTGWRSFVTNVQDIADLPAGKSYIHCDWTCDLHNPNTGFQLFSSTGSLCNYRVLSDKTMVIYVYFIDANTEYRVVFNSIPVQISY